MRIPNNPKIRLHFNENNYVLFDSLFKELKDFEKTTITNYPNYDKTYDLLSKYIQFPKENILITNGANQGLNVAIGTLFRNKTIIVPSPTYYSIFDHIKNYNVKLRNVYYELKDNEFVFPKDQILKELKNSDGIIIVNPNNPLGNLISQNILLEIIKECEIKNKYCIIDEAYFDFSGESCVNKIKEFKNLVIVRSFSKIFGFAGIRLGYIIADTKLINILNQFQGEHTINSFACFAFEICLNHLNEILKIKNKISSSKDDLCKYLISKGITVYDSKTNFILIKCSDVNKLYNTFLDNNILVLNTSNYPNSNNLLTNTLRISTPIDQDLEYLKEVIENYFKGEMNRD